jgi:predicted nucleic acid-binding protein
MNLLKTKKIFITESIWYALIDSTDEKHKLVKKTFKDILDANYYLITSSYVVDSTIQKIKLNVSKEKADNFLRVVDDAVINNYLKIFWLNRRFRRIALENFLHDESEELSLTRNLLLIEQKKVNFVFSLNHKLYEQHGLKCLNLN